MLGGCEAIVEGLEEGDGLVFLLIRQTWITEGHIPGLWNLGCRPTGHLFDCSCRALAAFYLHPILMPGVVEMDELLQALDIAVVEKLLLEVRPWSFGGGTLRWHQS